MQATLSALLQLSLSATTKAATRAPAGAARVPAREGVFFQASTIEIVAAEARVLDETVAAEAGVLDETVAAKAKALDEVHNKAVTSAPNPKR